MSWIRNTNPQKVLDDYERIEGERLLEDAPEWVRRLARLIEAMPPYNRYEQIATGAMQGYKRALMESGIDERTATERAGLTWYDDKPPQ